MVSLTLSSVMSEWSMKCPIFISIADENERGRVSSLRALARSSFFELT